MLHISMYINDRRSAGVIRENLLNYIKRTKLVSILSTCNSAEKMTECIKKNDTDIYVIDFADIETGKQFAELIREKSLIPAIIMLNVSLDDSYGLLYLRPSAIVRRSDETAELIRAVSLLRNETVHANRYFVFKCNGETLRIPYENIEFFESSARKVMLSVFGKTEKYFFFAKLDDIEKTLPANFLRCHQSYIVNMSHIAKFDRVGRSFDLFSREQIFISRRMYAEASEKYERFLETS